MKYPNYFAEKDLTGLRNNQFVLEVWLAKVLKNAGRILDARKSDGQMPEIAIIGIEDKEFFWKIYFNFTIRMAAESKSVNLSTNKKLDIDD